MAAPNWIFVLCLSLANAWANIGNRAIWLGPHALGELSRRVSGEHLGNIYRMVLGGHGQRVPASLVRGLFMLITLFFISSSDGAWWRNSTCWANALLARFSRGAATINSTVTEWA